MATIQMQVNMVDNISAMLNNITNKVNATTVSLQNMENITSRQSGASAFDSINAQMQALQSQMRALPQPVIRVAGTKEARVEIDSVAARLHSLHSKAQAAQQIRIGSTGIREISAETGQLKQQLNNVIQVQAEQQTRIGNTGIRQVSAETGQLKQQLNNVIQAQAAQQTRIGNTGIREISLETGQLKQKLNNVLQVQAAQQTKIGNTDIRQISAETGQLKQKLNNVLQVQTAQQTRIGNTSIRQISAETGQLKQKLNNVLQVQAAQQTRIGNTGIREISAETRQLKQKLNNVLQVQAAQQTKIGSTGIREISAETGQLKQQLNNVIQVQRQLGTASSRMNITEVSKTHNRLNTTIANTRRYIDRKTMAQQRFNDAVHKKGNNATVITKAYDRLSTTIRNMRRYIDSNAMTQERFNGMINRGKKAAADLKNKFSGTAKVLQRIAKIGFGFTNASIDKAMQQAQVKQRLENSLRGSGASREQIIAVQQRAFDIQDTTIHSANSMMVGTKELSRVITDMERLKNMMDVLANYAAAMTGGIAASEQEMAGLARAMNKAIYQGDVSMLEEKTRVRFGEREREWMEIASQEDREIFIAKIIDYQLGENFAEQMRQTPQGMRDAMLKSIGAIRTAFGEQLLPAVTLLFSTIESHLPTISKAFRALAVPVALIIGVLAVMTNIVFTIAAVIVDNWSMITPIIYGIAAALAILNAKLIHTKIKNVLAAIGKGILTAAVSLLKFAMMGLKAVMLVLSPKKLLIYAAIAAIVVIFNQVIAAINRFAGTSLSAMGIVGGAFAALGAFIWNIVVGVINAVIQFLWTSFVEPWISIIEFVLNVFNGGFDSFGDGVKNLLGNIISWFVSLGTVVTKIIDAIFGTNWTAGFNNLRSDLLSWGRNNNAITLDDYRTAPELLSRISVQDTWNAGYGFTSNLNLDLFRGNGNGDGSDASYPGYSGCDGNSSFNDYLNNLAVDGMGGIANNVANIAHNTDRTAEITEENLKYWRDIAEREAINRFTTAEVNIDFGGISNTVNSNMDLDSIVNYIAEGVEEAIQITAEKSYA